jgi:hypothetical protein
MKALRFVQMKSILWVLVGLIWLLTGCQTNQQSGASAENAVVINPTVSSTYPQTPVSTTLVTVEATLTPSATPQPSAMVTEQHINITTPIPLPPITIDGINNQQFYPQIVLLAGGAGNRPAIGIFDTQVNALGIVAQPTDDLSLSRPLWSPGKNLLAFSQFDSSTNTHSIQIYDPRTGNSDYLELTKAPILEGDTQTGSFLYGWSHDSQWLAYCYIYESLHQICYTVNVLTQENTLIELPNSAWLVWSPYSEEFAMTDNETIYIGNANAQNKMTAYRGNDFLGLMAWHPTQNEILVGSKRNIIEEGLSQLRQLNIDRGEWTDIGSFPHMAHFAFSPDGQFIAIHSQSRTLETYRLEIIDASTFESVEKLELPSRLFFDLDWLDNQTVALTANDNIYVIPLEEPEKAYWILDDDHPLYEEFSQITIADW